MTREEAIKDIKDNIKPVVGGKSLDMAISALRQPDVIYCKDCKFYTAYDYTGKLMCKRIGKGMILPKPEDYCSYAERITDGKPD